MKKLILFCSLLCGIVFAGGAWADNDLEDNDCYRFESVFSDNSLVGRIYFDTGKSTLYTGNRSLNCTTLVQELKEKLDASVTEEGVAGFIVIGSTSKLGTPSANAQLGKERAEVILKNVLPEWTKDRYKYGNKTGASDYVVHVIDAGETNDEIYGSDAGTNDSLFERSSTFIVVPKKLTCGNLKQYQTTRDFIEKYKDKVKLPQVCIKLLDYCKDTDNKLDFIRSAQIDEMGECIQRLTEGYNTIIESAPPETRIQYEKDWKLVNVYVGYFSRVDTAYNYLSVLLDNKNLSVWKDAQGKFNKSRFLSDTIAAVVLGTTSGVVTATLVKKNQIKKGFESLQCKIGGYKVADWGDSFMVGMTMR